VVPNWSVPSLLNIIKRDAIVSLLDTDADHAQRGGPAADDTD